jgi:hypothetical protein
MRGTALLDTADAAQVLDGREIAGRFGWAVALTDMNADGRADLAVSSPAVDAENLEFRGRVVVFFGRDGPRIFSDSPDLVIDGGEDYTRLGWSLASGDVNRDGASDLLVGAPYAGGGGEQRGVVALYLADGSLRSGTSWKLADADWLARGEADYDWFGYHTGVSLGQAGSGARVFVGAPGVDSGDAQAVGRLYAYDPTGPDPYRTVFTLTGESEFDKAGSAFVCAPFSGDGSEILALAAPTRGTELVGQAGEVFLADPGAWSGHLNLADLDGVSLLRGNREFGRMGWRLAAGHVNRDGVADLLVTHPWQGGVFRPMHGGATLWKGGAQLTNGSEHLPFRADAFVIGSTERARLGDAALLGDLNGDGLDDLILSASRDSTRALYSGAVSVYFTPACDDRDNDGYGAAESVSCLRDGLDCDDDPSDDPDECAQCLCGSLSCAGCARCTFPGGSEFPLDDYDSNCNGEADCFIAQAAFGSELAGKIDLLRAFRDRVLLTSGPGAALVEAYYRVGPGLAEVVSRSEVRKRIVRVLLLPWIGFAFLM